MKEKFDIEDLVRRLLEDLPASLQAVRARSRGARRPRTARGARKLDLVSREEFDAQAQVLARSRALIDAARGPGG